MRRFLASRLGPWTGLYASVAAWAVHHQVGSSLTFADCRLGGPALHGGLGLVCALVALLGGVMSWRARGEGKGREISGDD